MTESLADQLRRETAKRDRCWSGHERWRVLQETLTWAEAQQNPPRNSVQCCLARQRMLAAGIENFRTTSPRVAEEKASFGKPKNFFRNSSVLSPPPTRSSGAPKT